MRKKDWADYAAEMFADDHEGEELMDLVEQLAELLRCAERRRRGLLVDIDKFVESFYGQKRRYSKYLAANK